MTTFAFLYVSFLIWVLRIRNHLFMDLIRVYLYTLYCVWTKSLVINLNGLVYLWIAERWKKSSLPKHRMITFTKTHKLFTTWPLVRQTQGGCNQCCRSLYLIDGSGSSFGSGSGSGSRLLNDLKLSLSNFFSTKMYLYFISLLIMNGSFKGTVAWDCFFAR